jgi:threonine dehydrogenase-like Zn-dependent dehydrogenase
VRVSPFERGQSAFVLGSGPIGLSVVQVLKAKGCSNIIVSELAPRRKEFAKEFGAHHVLDPTKDDIVAKVRELTDGQGAHIAFDTAGDQAGLDQAIQAIRARGTLVNIAVWEKPASIQPNNLVFKERSYLGIATFLKIDFEQVLDALSTGMLRLVHCKLVGSSQS